MHGWQESAEGSFVMLMFYDVLRLSGSAKSVSSVMRVESLSCVAFVFMATRAPESGETWSA